MSQTYKERGDHPQPSDLELLPITWSLETVFKTKKMGTTDGVRSLKNTTNLYLKYLGALFSGIGEARVYLTLS